MSQYISAVPNGRFETVQILKDGTHDIEVAIELPKRDNGDEHSICIRASRLDGETYMSVTHEVEGNHKDLGYFKISEDLFDELAKICG